jgi:sigma-B regulation protein RsbU (phosphoserine phosphatase)
MDGFGVLGEIASRELDVTVMMITAHGTVQTAVQAMQEGAFDFLQKPFQLEDVERKVRRALEQSQLRQENQRLQQELAEAKDQLINDMQRDLQEAHDMQMGLLPKAPPEVEGMELSGICIPSRHVGGDFYDFLEELNGNGSSLGIVIADVSGKGMQAATVAMRFSEMLRYEAQDRSAAAEILKGLDRSLKTRTPVEMFVTCGIGILDVEKRSLTIASAANPEVFHYSGANGEVRPLQVTGYPLGMPLDLESVASIQSTTVDLQQGDIVVFTSDGVEEARDTADEFYGQERLAELIRDRARKGASADAIRNDIVADVVDFMGGRTQVDDITVVVLRVE